MRFFKQQEINLEEYQQVFETAAWMPYDWNRVVGYLLGDRNYFPGPFGGSCFNKSIFVQDRLPKGFCELTWDQVSNHFGVVVDGIYHFDPTYYQLGIRPSLESDEGSFNIYPSLLQGARILTQRSGDMFSVRIDNLGIEFSMKKLKTNVATAANYVHAAMRRHIKHPPFILFPTIDRYEAKVKFNVENKTLAIKDGRGLSPQNDQHILSEMEQTYGFSSEDLLRYFTESWRRVSRMVNVD